MLVLTRKLGESITIGNDIKINIIEIKGKQVQVGITAPPSVRIYREEIFKRVQEENKKAAKQTDVNPLKVLDALNKGR